MRTTEEIAFLLGPMCPPWFLLGVLTSVTSISRSDDRPDGPIEVGFGRVCLGFGWASGEGEGEVIMCKTRAERRSQGWSWWVLGMEFITTQNTSECPVLCLLSFFGIQGPVQGPRVRQGAESSTRILLARFSRSCPMVDTVGVMFSFKQLPTATSRLNG